MYKYKKAINTSLTVNTSYTGETIEQKIDRILNNKEPLSDGAPLIYTDRSEGVKPEHDIRTDRFEIAVEAMDKVSKAKLARREENQKAKEEASKPKKTETGTQGSDPASGGPAPVPTT